MPEKRSTKMDEQDTKLLLRVLLAVRKGDFSAQMPENWTGVNGKIADTLNEIIELKQRMHSEITHISQVVGKEGKLSRRIRFESGLGSWTDTVGAINDMIGDLTLPTTEMSRVIGAVAKGDLTQSVALEIGGTPLEGEVMRTARTVKGRLRGRS